MTEEKVQVRFVLVRGSRYLHVDDVAAFIRELAATEETDVRNRLLQAATNIAAPFGGDEYLNSEAFIPIGVKSRLFQEVGFFSRFSNVGVWSHSFGGYGFDPLWE